MLHEFLKESATWTFNGVYSIHKYDICYKLVDHPIACHLNYEEKDIVYEMKLNMVQPKNILATLKREKH